MNRIATRVSGLHVLIDPDRVPPDRVAWFVAAVARAGARVIQIRIKKQPTRAALAYGGVVLAHARPRGLTVIVNDRVDWALALGADGVHLGQDDMPLAKARTLGPGLILGASAGSRDEVAAVLPDRPDYLGVGPVYSTPSKPDAGQPLGVEGLTALIRAVPAAIPVIAIGGITPANAEAVWAAGVAGIAVIHAVAGSPDPEAAVRALLAARSTGSQPSVRHPDEPDSPR
jgi:thiamine-phosphate diphosphorylase